MIKVYADEPSVTWCVNLSRWPASSWLYVTAWNKVFGPEFAGNVLVKDGEVLFMDRGQSPADFEANGVPHWIQRIREFVLDAVG